MINGASKAVKNEGELMRRSSDQVLPWPLEAAVPPDDAHAELSVPGSNIVLDLHGNPMRAKLAVFSDGNHHMALEEALRAFVEANPEVDDIFYATTPPRVIVETLEAGTLRLGNVSLSITPHVFISPGDVLENLHSKGLVGPHAPMMTSTGLAILVRKGNPRKVSGPLDLLGPDVKLAISNPVTERASFSVYCAALCAFAEADGRSATDTERHLSGDEPVNSQIIHHREIPQILASGLADASLIYYHLALRYTRIFPDLFDLIEVDLNATPDPSRYVTPYHLALVGDGGEFGARFADFYRSPEAAEIYRRHGLAGFASA